MYQATLQFVIVDIDSRLSTLAFAAMDSDWIGIRAKKWSRTRRLEYGPINSTTGTTYMPTYPIYEHTYLPNMWTHLLIPWRFSTYLPRACYPGYGPYCDCMKVWPYQFLYYQDTYLNNMLTYLLIPLRSSTYLEHATPVMVHIPDRNYQHTYLYTK